MWSLRWGRSYASDILRQRREGHNQLVHCDRGFCTTDRNTRPFPAAAFGFGSKCEELNLSKSGRLCLD
jgi:hypothetical protein